MKQKTNAPSNGPASSKLSALTHKDVRNVENVWNVFLPTQHQTSFAERGDIALLSLGVETVCLMYSVHCTVVARSSFAASWGASHMDVVNVSNAWTQFLTKLSGGSTSGLGIARTCLSGKATCLH